MPLKLTIYLGSFLFQDFNAKLGAFEWARIGPETGETYIITSLAGTLGCLDPEYVKTGMLQFNNVIQLIFQRVNMYTYCVIVFSFFFTKQIIIVRMNPS